MSTAAAAAATAPTILDVLPSDALGQVMDFVGTGHYRYVAGTCRAFREAYCRQYPSSFLTCDESIVGSKQTAKFYMSESLMMAEKQELSSLWTPPSRRKEKTVPFSDYVLQWASRYGRLEPLQWILDNDRKHNKQRWWDHSVPTRRLTLEAAAGGHIACFDFLLENGYKALERDFESAARNGQLAFLDHFRKKNGLVAFLRREKQKFNLTNMRKLCNEAAECGHLEVLQFLHQTAKCHWSSQTCVLAAQNGHLDCLQHLHENGCHWKILQTHRRDHISGFAAAGGIDTLKYVHEHGSELSSWAYVTAAAQGHLDCLIYLEECGVEMDAHIDAALLLATEMGRISCLKHLLKKRRDDNPLPLLPPLLEAAAKHGQAKALSVLCELDSAEWDELDLASVLMSAAMSGSLDCVVFLLNLDCRFSSSASHQNCLPHVEWDELDLANVLRWAAICGSLECLLFLLNLDHRFSSSAMHEVVVLASEKGHQDFLHHCLPAFRLDVDSDCLEKALMAAAKHGSSGCLSCLLNLDQNWSQSAMHDAVKAAARYGHIDCLIRLLNVETNQERGCLHGALVEVFLNDVSGIDCLAYLVEFGRATLQDSDLEDSALIAAAAKGRSDCLTYLLGLDYSWSRLTMHGAAEEAAEAGHVGCLRSLAGLHVNRTEQEFLEKALVASAKHGSLDCLKYLRRLDHNWSTISLHRALRVAAEANRLRTVYRLLEFDVHWDQRTLSQLVLDLQLRGGDHTITSVLKDALRYGTDQFRMNS